MKLLILCEGETEERFVKDVLAPYLENSNIFAIPTNLGGVSKYSIIRTELDILCRDSSAFVTTMLDYYKLPKDTPGKGGAGDIYKIASDIEAAVKSNLSEHRNLLFNLIIHEFEGLLFSDVSAFEGEAKADGKALLKLARIKNSFPTPEHINDSEETAPSKRIKKYLSYYSKTLNGISIAKRIGIEKMAEECKHFKTWLESIQALGQEGAQ